MQDLEWIDQLLKKSMPSVSGASTILLRMMTQNTLSYKKMSEVIRNDPVLALNLLNNANTRTHSQESLVKTLGQAISLLGTDFLENLLQNTPPPERASIPAVVAYNKAVANSFFAAHLTQWAAQQKHRDRHEEYYWFALFYGMPLWLLWRYTPKKMQAWTNRLNHSLNIRKSMESKIFGERFAVVWKKIHDGFALPEVITDTPIFDDFHNNRVLISIEKYCRDRYPSIKPSEREDLLLLNHPGFIVALCNLIAFHAERDFYSAITLRLIRCLAVYLERSLKDTLTYVHELAVDSARQHPLQAGNALVAQLITGPDIKYDEEEEEQTEPSTPKAKIEAAVEVIQSPEPEVEEEISLKAADITEEEESYRAPSAKASRKALPTQAATVPKTPDNRQMRQANQDLYIDITQTMLRSPAQFKDIATLMNGAARCITYGVGLRTCVIALINTSKTRLKGYYAADTQDRPELARMDLDLTKASLFSKLMEKPSSIWINPGSSDKVKKMIPTEFRAINQTMDFFLTSCFVKSRPVALIYADAGIDALPLTEYEYECFKHVCGATSQVLYYFAQRNHKGGNRSSS
ncbi:HDOD domain-containing protein [Hahella sp. CCB-MM4]|uniref:HDOD domain-containing protein n=1 Tax=Hahella sp. (strain CCB-MM4) TaxID=1926491 RepID=UPI00143D6BF5|nr:HDOD domain-containing protein [Hahella sp. CCB-MM4]